MADSTDAPVTTGGYNPLNSTFGNAAPVGGRRHMKKVSAKTIKRTLKKLGMKPKGRMVLRGGEMEAMGEEKETPVAAAGRRRRGGKKTKRRSASKGKLGIMGL